MVTINEYMKNQMIEFLNIKKTNIFNEEIKKTLITFNQELNLYVEDIVDTKNIIIDDNNNLCTGELFVIHMWLNDFLIKNDVEVNNIYNGEFIKKLYYIYCENDPSIIFPMGLYYQLTNDEHILNLINKINLKDNVYIGDFIVCENSTQTIKNIFIIYKRLIVFHSMFYDHKVFYNTPSYMNILNENAVTNLKNTLYFDLIVIDSVTSKKWLENHNYNSNNNELVFNMSFQKILSLYRNNLLFTYLEDDEKTAQEIFSEELYLNVLKNIFSLSSANINTFFMQIETMDFYNDFINNFMDIDIDKLYLVINEKEYLPKFKLINNDFIKLWFIRNLLTKNYIIPAFYINNYLSNEKKQTVKFPDIIYEHVNYTEIIVLFNEKFNIYEYISKEHNEKNMIIKLIHHLFYNMNNSYNTGLIKDYLINIQKNGQLDKLYRLLELFNYPGKIINISNDFRDIYYNLKNFNNDNMKQWMVKQLIKIGYNELANDMNKSINNPDKKIDIQEQINCLYNCLTTSMPKNLLSILTFVSSQPNTKLMIEIIDINGNSSEHLVEFNGFFAEKSMSMTDDFFVVCNNESFFVRVK